jgi:hypothetical protein
MRSGRARDLRVKMGRRLQLGLPDSGVMTTPTPDAGARRTTVDAIAAAMRGDPGEARVLLSKAENLPAAADALVQLAAARVADVRLEAGPEPAAAPGPRRAA